MKRDTSREKDTGFREGSDSQASERSCTDTGGQDGVDGVDASKKGAAGGKTKRWRTKIEERVVQEASSSESVAESTSERIERSDTSVTKRTVTEKKLGTKTAQSKKSTVSTDRDSDDQKSRSKVPSSKKKATTTPRMSSKERRVEESSGSEEEIVSTEICEEEIIEKRATELSVVEIQETKAPGEATTTADDTKAKTSSKKDQGGKRQVKQETADKHDGAGDAGGKAKAKKEADRGDPLVEDKSERHGSTRASVSSNDELEAAHESLESSQEIVSVTKETSSVRFKEEVVSEETRKETSDQETAEHRSEIIAAESEPPISTASVAGKEQLEKGALVEQEKATEKTEVSNTVAEAVMDLYGRVQRASPSSPERLASQQQSQPGVEHVPSEGARKEGTDSGDSVKASATIKDRDHEHESLLKKSPISPLVAEAVGDLYAHVKQLASVSTSPNEKDSTNARLSNQPSFRTHYCRNSLWPRRRRRS
ncbi:hypothetical protein MTO96_011117 [Rhipicephalus appendiculatus]